MEASAILLASNLTALPLNSLVSGRACSHSHGPTRMHLSRCNEGQGIPLTQTAQSIQQVLMPSSRVANLQIRLALASILKLHKKQKTTRTPPIIKPSFPSRLFLGFLARRAHVARRSQEHPTSKINHSPRLCRSQKATSRNQERTQRERDQRQAGCPCACVLCCAVLPVPVSHPHTTQMAPSVGAELLSWRSGFSSAE